MILVIDNYDSFVHNLARYLRRLGQETLVLRNDAVTPHQVAGLGAAAIVLSPGPCTPQEAGCSLDLVQRLAGKIPILGICLGHQTIGAALDGKIVRAPEPMHGRTSLVYHRGSGIFKSLASPLTAARYHSLVIDPASLPSDLEVTARTSDGVIMAVEHRRWPVCGVQFHPESIMTEGGYQILENFLSLAGVEPQLDVPSLADERPLAVASTAVVPPGPVTF